MSRKTALRVDVDTSIRSVRVPSKSRGRRGSTDGQLVGEVIAIAFDRCEAAAEGSACGARPDAICSGCGTARCSDHMHGSEDDRSCSSCAASMLLLATAPFDAVLDTRMRLVTVPRL